MTRPARAAVPLIQTNDLLAVAARVEEMVQRGELERALVMFQTDIVKQSPEEIARIKTRSTWPGLVVAMAVHGHTMRALAAYRFDMPAALTAGPITRPG